jgi:hypothetical protein
MDNVQKTNNCINMPSSQTFRSEIMYLFKYIHDAISTLIYIVEW